MRMRRAGRVVAETPTTLCLSVNDVILHGIPDETPLRPGDILSVDCGACVNGLHADAATTVAVGAVDPDGRHLIETTRIALRAAIQAVRVGLNEVAQASRERVRYRGAGASR